MNTKKGQAFLILSDKSTDELVDFYELIDKSTRFMGDSLLMYHQKDEKMPSKLEHINTFSFTDDLITQSNYFPIGFSLVPGNNHFPLISFFLQNPGYSCYWCIEDDVFFSGDWKEFFRSVNYIDSDFISSHVHFSKNDPGWFWWKSLAHPYQVIPFEQRVRSFNPIYRISREAVAYIHEALLSGWCGHHEVLLPTLLYHAGFNIIDFGGTGEFVLPGYQNRYYIDNSKGMQDGTMRFRPVFKEVGKELNKLYHPLKG
jgi:hypothetical protein